MSTFWVLVAIVIAVLFIAFAVMVLTAMFGSGEVNGTAGRRQGHNSHDSLCVYWMGDFSGVDLRARCSICAPE